jgi:hypothetical protein
MRPRLLVIALGLIAAAKSADAQRLTGAVRDTSTGEPLAGVVVSLLDSLRYPVARVITDAAGRYTVVRPANASLLRVMRIGYQPRLFVLPAPEAVGDVDVAMHKVATLLSTIVVNDDRVCSPDKDRVGALSLWEQARAGLLTAVVAREQMPARASIMSYERTLDAGDGRLLHQTAHTLRGQTTRPFIAGQSARELAVRGYLLRRPDGDQVLAPDADVLLDDTFAATHCFNVAAGDATHPGLVGLAFEPVRGRDTLLDVRGTLWLESGVPSLHSLEFQYAGRRADADLKGSDGWIHFRAMPNGVVFIDEWQVRLPVYQKRITVRGPIMTRVVQRYESGGVVLTSEWPDGLKWRTALAPLTGVVRERGSSVPVAGALVSLEHIADTVVTDSAGRFSMHPVLPGRYSLQVTDTSFGAFVAPRTSSAELLVIHDQPPTANPELTSRGESVKKLCANVDVRGVTSTIVGRLLDAAGTPATRDTRLTARWLRTTTGGTLAEAKSEFETVDPDEAGRFSFCAVPRDRAIRITASRPNIEFADTVVLVPPNVEVMAVEWPLDLRTLASMVPPKPTVLRGRVLRAGTTTPLAGAEVWLPMADRRVTTDSSGDFRVDSLREGSQYVQVRKVGFAALRDTVTIAASSELRRDFSLIASSQVLDTVRTVASSKYISPLLRGFEERRANHVSGYFITDSILRKNDNSNIGNVIVSRMSGIALTPGRGSASYLVNTRKMCAGAVLSCTGVSTCYVTVYLDGILYYSATTREPPPDVSRLMVTEFAAVEYYPSSGTGPPQYNATGSGCGTLLLWTRER